MTDTWGGPRALANATGVSTDTLRHYERLGLLPHTVRTRSGYRRYAPDCAERVRLIQRALTVGFSLKELAGCLERRERGDAPCRHVRELVGQRLVDLDARLLELTQLRKEMRALLSEWDARLAQTPDGQRARLLDVLAVRPLRDTRLRPLPRHPGRRTTPRS
jgi:DNA-binding transcriptional MerR regulator